MALFKEKKKIQLILVSGPAGAGRTTAIRSLEDLGFEAIDNLPLDLVKSVLKPKKASEKIAIGLDTRGRDFSVEGLLGLLKSLLNLEHVDFELLYLSCTMEVLLRRYSETRRRHPLADGKPPHEGIEQELILLEPIRHKADILIETSDLTLHDLKASINKLFLNTEVDLLSISLKSFSYKRGLPRGADMTFDCRFLKNPHWQDELRDKTGLDHSVRKFVLSDPKSSEFIERVTKLLLFLLPEFKKEGKSSVEIGFGCTGGIHRSVAVTETVAKALADLGWNVSIKHREIERLDL
ncbi:RNase adapter RapZ [Paracoccaceae bacterium]|nr:RNase adapter RapZ [Paracoccaceae bacterium]